MKVLILRDRESVSQEGISLHSKIKNALSAAGSDIEEVALSGDEIDPCIGCYSCWIKTPGICFRTDDPANTLAARQARADVVVIISRITYGGYSYDIKSLLDRSIQNISPYFEIINGEMHHKKRYEKFPILISFGYGDFTSEEGGTFAAITERNAINMQAKKHCSFTVQNDEDADSAVHSFAKMLAEGAPK